jgi:periplasmic protein TonB
MKTKGTLKELITLTLLLALPCIAAILITFSSCGRNRIREANMINVEPPQLPPPPPRLPSMTGSDTAWQIMDEIPLLPGGKELLVNYIAKNIKYPETAMTEGIEGVVVVKFFISRKGDVTGHEIFKSVNPDLDAEALRVIKTLTKFEPARRDGIPVPAWYYVPINFKLR